MGITIGVGKTSQNTLGFPQLYQGIGAKQSNLQESGVIPLSHTLNNKNNLLYISKLFRREGVD